MVNGATCRFALYVLRYYVFALRLLPLRADAVMRIRLVNSVPVIDRMRDRLIFTSLVVLENILIRVMRVTVTLINVPGSRNVATVYECALIVRNYV